MTFNPNLYTHAQTGLGLYRLKAWSSVVLYWPCRIEADRVVRHADDLAFRFGDGPLCAAAPILEKWRARLNLRYHRAASAKAATLAHTTKLAEWVTLTESMATDVRLVYGDRLADLLRATAEEMRETIGWLALRVSDPPGNPKAIADLLLTVDLWAWDQFRAVVDCGLPGIPGKDAGRTALLSPAILALQDANLPFMKSDDGWKMRVARLRIRPGEADNLMADVLFALCSHTELAA